MGKFIFNDITLEDVMDYLPFASVFNMTKNNIDNEWISFNSIDDERLGSTEEKVFIAVQSYDKIGWSILDIDSKIDENNSFPISYVLGDCNYSKILVVIRTMSDFVLDTVKEKQTVFLYNRVDDRLGELLSDKALLGYLASNRIVLDGSMDSISKIKSLSDKEKASRVLKYFE